MSRDAAKGAAVALRRLAREQDAIPVAVGRIELASGVMGSEAAASACAGIRAALSVTRGEAARAVESAIGVPLWNGQHAAAMMQWRALTGSAPIPSATLDVWADGWDAYAARETDPGERVET